MTHVDARFDEKNVRSGFCGGGFVPGGPEICENFEISEISCFFEQEKLNPSKSSLFFEIRKKNGQKRVTFWSKKWSFFDEKWTTFFNLKGISKNHCIFFEKNTKKVDEFFAKN